LISITALRVGALKPDRSGNARLRGKSEMNRGLGHWVAAERSDRREECKTEDGEWEENVE
jgi:hypothetical protein